MTHMTAGGNGLSDGLWVQREDGVLLTRAGVYEVLLGLQTYLATVPPRNERPNTIADTRLAILDGLRLELQDAVLNAISPPANDAPAPKQKLHCAHRVGLPSIPGLPVSYRCCNCGKKVEVRWASLPSDGHGQQSPDREMRMVWPPAWVVSNRGEDFECPD